MARLDRLSALLDGLSPQIEIAHAGELGAHRGAPALSARALYIHLLVRGELGFETAAGVLRLAAPATVVVRSDQEHGLRPGDSGSTVLCARVHFEGPARDLVLDAFSSPAVVGLGEAAPDLGHLIALIGAELEHPRCGHDALLTRAGEILLITVLRHIIAQPRTNAGLLAALADPRIARAVVAMHERPAARWRLESLADEAGMSRTAFAVGFRERMGVTPGGYLARLRLAIAEDAVHAGKGLKRAALAAGYASPAALSRALARRRVAGFRSPPEAARAPRSRAA